MYLDKMPSYLRTAGASILTGNGMGAMTTCVSPLGWYPQVIACPPAWEGSARRHLTQRDITPALTVPYNEALHRQRGAFDFRTGLCLTMRYGGRKTASGIFSLPGC